jgi:hypothetical protein
MYVPAAGFCMALLVLFQLDHLEEPCVNERVILK